MVDDALELVKMRNEFYRDNYRRLAVAVLVAMLVILLMAGMVLVTIAKKPEPRYFATADDGRILPLVPVNVPYKSTPQVLQWATEAALAAYSYDYVNYRKQLQNASDYFTPDGWAQYMSALQSSGNLEAVKEGKIIATAVPTGAAQLQQEGLLDHAYAWQVSVPIRVSFQGQTTQQTIDYNVSMKVARVSTLDKADGIGVQQIIVNQQAA